MNRQRSQRYDFSFNSNNIKAIIAICILAGAWLSLSSLFGQVRIDETIPVDYQRISAAREKIDPNTASVASLCRLRKIGEAKARSIIEYRSVHGPKAFKNAEDLSKVKGIGPAIVKLNSRDIEIKTRRKGRLHNYR